MGACPCQSADPSPPAPAAWPEHILPGEWYNREVGTPSWIPRYRAAGRYIPYHRGSLRDRSQGAQRGKKKDEERGSPKLPVYGGIKRLTNK